MSSMSSMLQTIVGCLTTINNNHGRGDVIGVVMDENYKGGTVTLKLANAGTETRRFGFNCSSNTVYYLAHQRTFPA